MSATRLGDPHELERLAGFRLRTAAVARNTAWITLAGIAALTMAHHPPQEVGEHWLVWSVLAAAFAANLATYSPFFSRFIQRSQQEWPFHLWALLLLLFDGAVVYLSKDAQHQVYLIYIPVLLFAVATLDSIVAIAVVGLAIATSLQAIELSEGLSTDVVIGTIASFIVVSLFGAYLSGEQRQEMAESAYQRAEAERSGEELRHLNERARALNDQLQRTVGKVIRAQEEERRRIGRELHDETVQLLSAAAVRVGELEERVPESLPQLADGLADVRGIITDALWEVRKIIVALRPSDLDDLGLIPALSAYARNRLNEAGVAVEAHLERPAYRLDSDVETTVFRIAQEAVNNISRHAAAQHAVIRFSQRNGTLELNVQDDGIGFDPNGVTPNDNGEGLGLLGMKERAALVGGALELVSRPGRGTSVNVRIPLRLGVAR
jgi:signal transduction histidine kinase